MNIAVLEMSGYEADDIIGTLSVKGTEAGFRTLIISGDKDGLQLVSPNVHVLINKRGMSEFDVYDIEAMKERYNLTPEQFIDLKALMGDKSDNISQVLLRCGPKTALSLVKNKDELKKKLVESADATEKYNLNKKIISFSEIPAELTERIKKAINESLYSEDVLNPASDLKSFMMGF
jgi:DNA polymerase-1